MNNPNVGGNRVAEVARLRGIPRSSGHGRSRQDLSHHEILQRKQVVEFAPPPPKSCDLGYVLVCSQRDSRPARTVGLARPSFLSIIASGVLSLALITSLLQADSPTVEQLIQRAGNAEDDAQRLQILRQLQAREDLNSNLRDEAGQLAAVVDRWVHGPQLFQWFHKDIREPCSSRVPTLPWIASTTTPFAPATRRIMSGRWNPP